MSQSVLKDKKIFGFSIAAAATTMIAGVMHLMMVQMSLSHDLGEGILFLVGGILQVFWAVPVVKQWGRVWQAIGILGTVVFVALWFATHIDSLTSSGHAGTIPGGPPPRSIPQGGMQQGNITGGHFPRGPPLRGIASIPQIEYYQFAFIGIYATISCMIRRNKNREAKTVKV